MSINSQFDKNLAQKLFTKVDPNKTGRVEMYNLVSYLKKIPGKFNKPEVIKRIVQEV